MSKTLEFNNGKFYVQVDWEEQINTEANTSTMTITGLRFMTPSWYGIVYYLSGAVTIGDQRISVDDGSVYIGAQGKYFDYSGDLGSVTVKHLDDGTLTVSIGVDISGHTTSGGAGSGWKIVGAENVTLTTIPRASAIDHAGDIILGNACNVRWIPASAEFKFKLQFSIGDWSKTTDVIQPNTTGSYIYSGYIVPLEAAEQMPDAIKGAMKVTLYTYSAGDAQIGDADSVYVVATVPDNDSTKPTVSIDALAPVTALGSPFDTIFVQGKSKVKVSYSGTGRYGASVKSYSVSIGGETSEGNSMFTSDYLGEYGEIMIKVAVVDSRGFSNSATDTIEVIPYAKPKVVTAEGESKVICARCDGEGNLIDTGTSLKVKVKKSYSKIESGGKQNNFCKLWFKWKLASAPDSGYSDPVELICTDDTYDGVFDSVVFDKAVSYTVQLSVKDDVGESASMTFTILSEKVYWHRGEDFLALGMHSSAGGFEVAWPTIFYGNIQVGEVSLADYIRNIINEGG